MDWRRSKGLVLLATVLLVSVSLGVPPDAVQAVDGADPRHAFSAEEFDGLCREFEQGGLSYQDRGDFTGHISELACHLHDPNSPTYRSLVVIKLFADEEAAYFAWSEKGLTDDEYIVESEDVQLGLGYSYQVTLYHANSHIDITIKSAPKASLGLLESMKSTAMSIVDHRGLVRELDVAVELSMIPLTAKVTVTDKNGRPVANQRVKLILDDPEEQSTSYFDVLLQSRSQSLIRTIVHMAPTSVGSSPRPLQLMHPEPSTHSAWNDSGRHFLTGMDGEFEVRLDRFFAIEPGEKGSTFFWTNSIHAYFLGGYLRSGSKVGLTVRAYAVEVDEDGDDVALGESSSTLLIDHLAELKSVISLKKGSKTTEVTLDRAGQPVRQLKTKQVEKASVPLRIGDRILIDQRDAVTIDWIVPVSALVSMKEGRGHCWITIASSELEETDWGRTVRRAESFGVGLSLLGAGVFASVPEGYTKVAGAVGTVLGTLVYGFAGQFNPVQITYRSRVLMDVDETLAVYTLEGAAELATGPGPGVDIVAGQKSAIHPDGAIDPPSAFSEDELNEALVAVTAAVPEADQTPTVDAEPEAAVLFEDDFDGENDGLGMLDYGAFANWTVDTGTVDLIGNGYFAFYPDAGLFLDLDGSSNAGGTLVSKEALALQPGRYRLAFDLAGHPFNGPDTVTVTLGEHFVEDFTMPHDPDMSGFERVVRDIEVATGSEARLSFRQHGGDSVGVLLDEVRLSRLPSDAGEEGDEAEPTLVPAATLTPPPTPAPAPTPTVTAVPTSAPTPTPAPSVVPVDPTPMAVEPTPSPEAPVQEAARDLWFHEGDTLTRVDHLSGGIVERWDTSHPDCPAGHDGRAYVDADGEVAWLVIVDAEWEVPVLECLIRLPLDGSMGPEAYRVPSSRKPTFVNAAATQGEDLWAIIWKKQNPENPLSWYDDWSLARLDRWTGALTQVHPRVVALASTEAGLVVLYSEQGGEKDARRPQRLGIVEPGRKAPREIQLDATLPRTKPGTYVKPRLRLSAGHEGTVALYDEYAARDVLVFDPASGAVMGRVTPPAGAITIGRAWPVSDGVWMSGLLEDTSDFVRFAPFEGWTSLEVDPCTDVAGDCYAQVESASDAGAWVSAWPYGGALEVDLGRVVMRRYDTTGQALAEVTGVEVFGAG